MKIIGLGYKARHGKDTVANIMQARYGGDLHVAKFSFAAALKEELELLGKAMGGMKNVHTLFDRAADDHIFFDNNPPMDDPDCPSGKQRGLLQWYGTQFWRAEDPDHWVKASAVRIAKSSADVVIVPDVRFLNEARWVKEQGGILVKVTCLDLPEDRALKANINHESETQLDGFQFDEHIVTNYGNLASLHCQAHQIFERYVFGGKQ